MCHEAHLEKLSPVHPSIEIYLQRLMTKLLQLLSDLKRFNNPLFTNELLQEK